MKKVYPGDHHKMNCLTFEFPAGFDGSFKGVVVPVSVNAMFVEVTDKDGTKKRVKTKKYREYRNSLLEIVNRITRDNGRPDDPANEYQLEIYLTVPDNRARDAHNYIKPICDIFEGVFWGNDKQIKDARAFGPRVVKGRWELVIRWRKIENREWWW